MAYIYRTPGAWGPGKGANLTAAEVDGNFWQAQGDIAAKAVQGVGIANITVTGNLMYVALSDHTLLGPYELPVATLNFRGAWAPNTSYLANDVVSENGAAYVVLVNHTSAAAFDPGANDGAGHNYYQMILNQPSVALPPGGPVGSFLMKASAVDYSTTWGQPDLEDLTDVSIASPLVTGDVLMWAGANWTNGVIVSSGGGGTLASLTDVLVSSPAVGQPLVFNGTKWANVSAVDLPCAAPIAANGAVTISRANGEWQRFSVTGNVTTNPITGWPTGAQAARLVLEIVNTSGYTWDWSGAGVLFPGGLKPVLTPNGKDVVVLLSFNNGATVYGNSVGQAYA
jgi:predicted ribosomally synthesized peptide with SipW-like signal peptide